MGNKYIVIFFTKFAIFVIFNILPNLFFTEINAIYSKVLITEIRHRSSINETVIVDSLILSLHIIYHCINMQIIHFYLSLLRFFILFNIFFLNFYKNIILNTDKFYDLLLSKVKLDITFKYNKQMNSCS